MKQKIYISNPPFDTNRALHSQGTEILGSIGSIEANTHFRDDFKRVYIKGRVYTKGRVYSERRGWMERFLFLFSRTWVALLAMFTFVQPHILENRIRKQNDFLQYSSNSEHHHLNHTHHHLPTPSHPPHNRNQSLNIHYRRNILQHHGYSRMNSNVTSDSKSFLGLKHTFDSLGGNKPDKRHASSPKEALLLAKYFRDLRRHTNHRQARDSSYNEYIVQGEGTEDDVDEVEDVGRPCVYSGHLKTEHNWYGYLANISLAGGTGRLVFEFSYPAVSCCLSVLFYFEDQLSIMSARTNCWQKEDLLRPDVDQILRLTPSFSWSGCQIKKRQGGDTMVCKGGRSFTKHGYDLHSLTNKDKADVEEKLNPYKQRNSDVASNAAVWYVAVSHCASLRGLNLRYKLKVYGHSVPCNADYENEDDMSSDKESHWPAKSHKQNKNPYDSEKKDSDVRHDKTGLFSSSSHSSSSSSSSYQSYRPSDAAHTHLASDEWPVCTIEGSVNTTHSWFGFIKNLSLVDGGGFRFYFSLPYSMSPMNVLLYHDEDTRKLHWEQICWLKESVIESKHVLERIIDLTSRSIYNGCASKTGANIEGNNLTCRGEKIFSGDRNIYIALSNCRSREGLLLKYKLEVFGYKDQTMCSVGTEIYPNILSFILFVFLITNPFR